MGKITIKEFREMAGGSDRLVFKKTVNSRHVRKAAAIFAMACDSVRQSGLRGHVSVYMDDKVVEFQYIDESGRLIV